MKVLVLEVELVIMRERRLEQLMVLELVLVWVMMLVMELVSELECLRALELVVVSAQG